MIKFFLAAVGIVFFTAHAFAAAKITGAWRYQFGNDNTTVTIGCDKVSNPSQENATGTLKLQLRALDQPYVSGSIGGKVLAEYRLEGLQPRGYYGPINKTLKTSLPGVKKAYFICLTVLEYKSGQYVIADVANGNKTVVLGPTPLFKLEGPWRWSTSSEGGTVDIEVAKISHHRPAVTGSLKLSVWATKSPYRGGGISGFELGSVKKEPLKTGFAYTNVKNTAKYTKPPPGMYYVSIVLAEFDGKEFRIVAHVTTPNASKF